MLFRRKEEFCLSKFLKKAKKYGQFEFEAYEEVAEYYESRALPVRPVEFGLTLLVISDIHSNSSFKEEFRQFISSVSEYDLAVILGDINQYHLDTIINYIPVNKIIALRGNHDTFDVYDKHGIHNINGSVYTYKGVRFAGIEGSLRYKNGAFPLYTHYESLELASNMQQEADVLLTHDCMFIDNKKDPAHSGMVGITYYVYNNSTKWHIHGHIHKSYKSSYTNGTIEKSVYGCEVVRI